MTNFLLMMQGICDYISSPWNIFLKKREIRRSCLISLLRFRYFNKSLVVRHHFIFFCAAVRTPHRLSELTRTGPHSRNLQEKESARGFLGSFGKANQSYDCSMVALETIQQSKSRLANVDDELVLTLRFYHCSFRFYWILRAKGQ